MKNGIFYTGNASTPWSVGFIYNGEKLHEFNLWSEGMTGKDIRNKYEAICRLLEIKYKSLI